MQAGQVMGSLHMSRNNIFNDTTQMEVRLRNIFQENYIPV